MNGTSLLPTTGRPKDPIPLLEKRLELLENENCLLHSKLQVAYRRLAVSEGEDPQMALVGLLEELRKSETERRAGEAAEKAPAPKSDSESKGKARRGHGPRPQPRLKVVEEIHELAESARECNCCGGQLMAMGEQLEEYEEITVIEREYQLRQVKRRKYRCRCNSCVVTAPGPTRLVPGGRYALDFTVQVAVDKYLDHLPLERQVPIMDRLGLDVDSQTLFDQLDVLVKVLSPSYEALGRMVLEWPVLHVDETRWPQLN